MNIFSTILEYQEEERKRGSRPVKPTNNLAVMSSLLMQLELSPRVYGKDRYAIWFKVLVSQESPNAPVSSFGKIYVPSMEIDSLLMIDVGESNPYFFNRADSILFKFDFKHGGQSRYREIPLKNKQ
ncbi:MAG: hypothetical protein ACK5IQ_03470 [Bacteroidales bacterium]